MSDLVRRLIRERYQDSLLVKLLTALVIDEQRLTAAQAVAINRAVKLVLGMKEDRDVQNFVGLQFIRELETLDDPRFGAEPVRPDWLYHQAS